MKTVLSVMGVLVLATLLIPLVHESSHAFVANYTGNEVVSMGYNYTEVCFKNESSKPIVYLSGFIVTIIVGLALVLVGIFRQSKRNLKGRALSIAGLFWVSSCLLEFSLGTDFAKTAKVLNVYDSIFFIQVTMFLASMLTLVLLFRKINIQDRPFS